MELEPKVSYDFSKIGFEESKNLEIKCVCGCGHIAFIGDESRRFLVIKKEEVGILAQCHLDGGKCPCPIY